ncbi:MAG: Potassium-transporting ATPase ATP-binding subunit [bacterium]|nr:Potassium-transporting ATPase ATP-binding subunit [bacterium]
MNGNLPTDAAPQTGADGLTSDEASARLLRYGPNAIVESVATPWKDSLKAALRDPMLWFLAATALLYFLIGDQREAIILLVAFIPIIFMDLLLSWRTHASTAGLRSLLASTARVRRDGQVREIPATGLVPGDVVLLQAPDSVPADGTLWQADALQIDESMLTGEALPVAKSADIATGGTQCFAGTRLLAGSGEMLVTATGARTRYGGIVRLVQTHQEERTPLQRAMDRLLGQLTVIAGGLCVLLFVAQLLYGQSWQTALLSAVTLAIAALPEEFPVVFSAFLGVGVLRLAKQHALVRRLVAVEHIGRVDCIATDKTGTITTGLLSLEHLVPAADVSAELLLSQAVLATGAYRDDPLDRALLEGAAARQLPLPDFPAGTYLPYTETSRRATFLAAGLTPLAVTKGAPETILQLCALPFDEQARWLEQTEALGATGHKVIGVAAQELPAHQQTAPESGYRWLGLLAFEDPIRPEVPAAIAACQSAGVQVIMVTGDFPATAHAIAVQAGVAPPGSAVVTGDEIDAGADQWTDAALRSLRIVARATPAQKLTLVQRLRAMNRRVAVSGDGINDAPALRAADVGIAMGSRGAQATRDVAALVLLDDNFATIVAAIGEAQRLYANLRRAFAYLLLIHAPLVLVAALLPLAGQPALLLPVHIVWLELVIHPTALLAFQGHSDGRPRLDPAAIATFFTTSELWSLGATGLMTTSGLCLWVIAQRASGLLDPGLLHGVIVASLICISTWAAIVQGALGSAAGRWIVGLALASGVLLMQWPTSASILAVAPLPWPWWVVVFGGAGMAVGGSSRLLQLLSRAVRR